MERIINDIFSCVIHSSKSLEGYNSPNSSIHFFTNSPPVGIPDDFEAPDPSIKQYFLSSLILLQNDKEMFIIEFYS